MRDTSTSIENDTQPKSIEFNDEPELDLEAQKSLIISNLASVRISHELKNKIAAIVTNRFNVTLENANQVTQDTILEMCNTTKASLEDSGVIIAPESKIDFETTDQNVLEHGNNPILIKRFQDLMIAYETLADSDHKQKLSNLEKPTQPEIKPASEFATATIPEITVPAAKETAEEKEHREGALLFRSLEKFKLPSDFEEKIVRWTLEINHDEINSNNASRIIRQTAELAQAHTLVNLTHEGFTVDADKNLKLPKNLSERLNNSDVKKLIIDLNYLLKITREGTPLDGQDLEYELVENNENKNRNNSTSIEAQSGLEQIIRQSLTKIGLSTEGVNTATDALILDEFKNNPNNASNVQNFEKIVQKVITRIEKEKGFTINDRGEIVLLSLIDKLNFFTKKKKTEVISNSSWYKILGNLQRLRNELHDKVQSIMPIVPKQHAQVTPAKLIIGTAIGLGASAVGAHALAKEKIEGLNEHTESTISYTPTSNKVTESKRDNTFVERGNIITPQLETKSNQAALQDEEDFSKLQKRRPINIGYQTSSEEPTDDKALVTETTPKPEQVTSAKSVDSRFKSTNFRKPTSLNRRTASNPKINPFEYQDPGSKKELESLPKLTRPSDLGKTSPRTFYPASQPVEFDPNKAPVLQDRDRTNDENLNTPPIENLTIKGPERKNKFSLSLKDENAKPEPTSAERLEAAQDKVARALGIPEETIKQAKKYSRETKIKLDTKSVEIPQEDDEEDIFVEPTPDTSTMRAPTSPEVPETPFKKSERTQKAVDERLKGESKSESRNETSKDKSDGNMDISNGVKLKQVELPKGKEKDRDSEPELPIFDKAVEAGERMLYTGSQIANLKTNRKRVKEITIDRGEVFHDTLWNKEQAIKQAQFDTDFDVFSKIHKQAILQGEALIEDLQTKRQTAKSKLEKNELTSLIKTISSKVDSLITLASETKESLTTSITIEEQNKRSEAKRNKQKNPTNVTPNVHTTKTLTSVEAVKDIQLRPDQLTPSPVLKSTKSSQSVSQRNSTIIIEPKIGTVKRFTDRFKGRGKKDDIEEPPLKKVA